MPFVIWVIKDTDGQMPSPYCISFMYIMQTAHKTRCEETCIVWSDFDHASSLIWGNKMPTRCNRCFLLQIYCLLNMFQAPLCPSSGARDYYTVGCCLLYLVLWFSSCQYGVELRVVCPVCGQMMGIMVPETCWASNKICNKKHLLHLVGILFPQTCIVLDHVNHYYDLCYL